MTVRAVLISVDVAARRSAHASIIPSPHSRQPTVLPLPCPPAVPTPPPAGTPPSPDAAPPTPSSPCPWPPCAIASAAGRCPCAACHSKNFQPRPSTPSSGTPTDGGNAAGKLQAAGGPHAQSFHGPQALKSVLKRNHAIKQQVSLFWMEPAPSDAVIHAADDVYDDPLMMMMFITVFPGD